MFILTYIMYRTCAIYIYIQPINQKRSSVNIA